MRARARRRAGSGSGSGSGSSAAAAIGAAAAAGTALEGCAPPGAAAPPRRGAACHAQSRGAPSRPSRPPRRRRREAGQAVRRGPGRRGLAIGQGPRVRNAPRLRHETASRTPLHCPCVRRMCSTGRRPCGRWRAWAPWRRGCHRGCARPTRAASCTSRRQSRSARDSWPRPSTSRRCRASRPSRASGCLARAGSSSRRWSRRYSAHPGTTRATCAPWRGTRERRAAWQEANTARTLGGWQVGILVNVNVERCPTLNEIRQISTQNPSTTCHALAGRTTI